MKEEQLTEKTVTKREEKNKNWKKQEKNRLSDNVQNWNTVQM